MARAKTRPAAAIPSRGRYVGTGNGPALQPIDIGHPRFAAVIEPDTAFWALVRRDKLSDVVLGKALPAAFRKKAARLAEEIHTLRFGLQPSAVYFNPTERCNLNCTYCYIPEKMRRSGRHMSREKLLDALGILKRYFSPLPRAAAARPGEAPTSGYPGVRAASSHKRRRSGSLPQIVFHGAEPLLNREAVFAGIQRYADDFRFGIQTNATQLDDSAVAFLREHEVSIGISLDAPTAAVADRTRNNWEGRGVYDQVIEAMGRLRGYPAWSVISTISSENLTQLSRLVDFLHAREVPTCLMNILRCTLPRSRAVKPCDAAAARYFLRALDRTHELYRRTGRKLIVGNFANILLAIVAPSARRLMCDISPCGGGRCFFALAPNGDLFPCSEFIGLEDFCGGNLFSIEIADVLESRPFRLVTGRTVETIEPCRHCAIRHFCGSPCPAEAHQMNGSMEKTGAFCEFYEEQVRYAFRLIADEKADDFLWDGWDEGMRQVLDFTD
ncbi:MAG: peptide-modifying radical SAM enzyme CbpB [Thermoguttaceae bacterium]|jgi:uncharacterized protein